MFDTDLLEKTEVLVKQQYDRLKCWAHAWPHIKKVKDNSLKLAKIVNTDSVSCAIAAYCHDLGRIVEQETRGKQIELGSTDHSSNSIKATKELLSELGVTGCDSDTIIEAVAVHSDKRYTGKNLIAKVLRDCDKKDSLGPWGTLRHIKHHFNKDLVRTQDIMKYQDNNIGIKILANTTLEMVKNGGVDKEKYLKVLDFVLEWVDNKMLDLEQSYDFLNEDYEFTKKSKEFLLNI